MSELLEPSADGLDHQGDAVTAPQHDLRHPADPRPASLAPLPDSGWQRVLCIAAHPDDMEYGTSAAVAAWTARGTEVSYALLTTGEAGMAEPPEVVAPLRSGEQRAACDTVGVTDLQFLGFADGMLQADLSMRKAITRVIRQIKPQAILTLNFDFEAYGGLNQADHRAAGLAVVDAARDASNPWVFRELLDDEGLQPWQARALLVAGVPNPTHAKPVDGAAVATAVASLRCHKAYLEHVTGHPDPAVFIPEALRSGGKSAGIPGTESAVTFRVYDLGGFDADAKEQAQRD